MRAAILLLPLIALGASIASGAPENRRGYDDENASMAAMNALDAAGNIAEMDLGTDYNLTDTNLTVAGSDDPAWLSEGVWLTLGDAPDGATWYMEAFETDFAARPLRVPFRADERSVPGSPYESTLRLIEFDCAKQRYRIVRTTHFDASGRASEADEGRDDRMIRPPDRSFYQGAAMLACGHVPQSGDVVTNAM